MGILKDFKGFVSRGNVVDLAVGVIMGGAFGKIVSSLVADIIMPPVGLLLGRVTINYGNFLQASIDFLILALAVFVLVQLITRVERKVGVVPPEKPPEPSAQEKLLAEIRDLLKAQAHGPSSSSGQ